MDETMLRADCARCAALCCVSLAFDRSELFAFDKPAGVPCSHLTPDHACDIHPALQLRGFSGCSRFDCRGAGQRVTREVFGGRSWREDPALARAMFDAFRAMREVHELLLLLHLVGRLDLTAPQSRTRAALEAALCPPGGWTAEALDAFERGPLASEVRAFLATLRDHVSEGGHPRRRLSVLT